jgi:O-succinylbenzoate synthase
MKIDAIEYYRVRMPLIYPFRTAFGDDACIESVLVRMTSGSYEGWGESAPWERPAYSPEFAAGSYMVIGRFIAPLIIGKDIINGQQLQDVMDVIKGNQFAKAALDTAWWDLQAKMLGKPLWKIIGGTGDTVDVGADFGIMESVDLLLETISEAIRQGFKRIKLKYRPGWELDMISRVRKAFPDTVFHVDCNSAYTLKDIDMFKMLDNFNLAMIEQPLAFDDLIDHSNLQKALKTPICLDESINSCNRARQAIEIGACKYINIKPGRVGGITNAIKIHDLCHASGIPLWIGGMLESSVGAAHCIALATLPGIKYPSDIFPSDRFYKEDLSTPETVLSAPSQVKASVLPGIGCVPDLNRLAKYSVEKGSARI